MILMIVFSRRFIVWKFPFKSLLRIFIAAACMGGVLYLLSTLFIFSDIVSVLIKIFIGAGIYALVLLVLGELSVSDIASFINPKFNSTKRKQ
jgi:hypothetical protein